MIVLPGPTPVRLKFTLMTSGKVSPRARLYVPFATEIVSAATTCPRARVIVLQGFPESRHVLPASVPVVATKRVAALAGSVRPMLTVRITTPTHTPHPIAAIRCARMSISRSRFRRSYVERRPARDERRRTPRYAALSVRFSKVDYASYTFFNSPSAHFTASAGGVPCAAFAYMSVMMYFV